MKATFSLILNIIFSCFIYNVNAFNTKSSFNNLIHAIDQNNIANIKDILQSTSIDRFELSSALMHATKKGQIDSMRLLISAGADVNMREGLDQPVAGQTPLAWAIHQQSLPAVKLLIEHGARVNDLVSGIASSGLEVTSPSNIRNNPILKFAIVEGASANIIELLIQSGADVNHNKYGIHGKNIPTWTPLMLAAYHGKLDIVKLLLHYGADAALKNEPDNNKTTLDYAKEKQHKEIVTILEQYQRASKNK